MTWNPWRSLLCLALLWASTPSLALLCRDLIVPDTAFVGEPYYPDPQGELDGFVDHIVMPVVNEGRRSEFAKIKKQPRLRTISITSPMGDYLIHFTDDPLGRIPKEGMPYKRIVNGRVQCEITLCLGTEGFSALRLQGLIRSMFGADPFLHPHLRPPVAWWPKKAIASYIQRDAITALLEMEGNKSRIARYKRGLVMPVGIGKTVVAAKYVDEIQEFINSNLPKTQQWKKRPKVLFVVENSHILDESAKTFENELGYRNILKVYGEGTKEPFNFTEDTEAIFITRSSYNFRRDEIHAAMRSENDQPWVLVIDEAHHTGKADGQFERILADLDSFMDHRFRVLTLSPHYWHRDKPLVTEYLDGNVYGAFLYAREQAELKKGQGLTNLARLQFTREAEMGYVASPESIDIITHIDGQAVADFLNPFRVRARGGARTITIPEPLVKSVAGTIKKRKIPGVPDRGVIYVSTQQQATALAEQLSEEMNADVRPYHRGEDETGEIVDPDTFHWFCDTGDYDKASEKKKAKYIVVVDLLHEGVNVPKINLEVLLRDYTATQAGVGRLIQNAGRASRVDALKPFYRLIDYTGFSRFLVGGLDKIMVEQPPKVDWREVSQAPITVNGQDFTPVTFRENFHRLFNDSTNFLIKDEFIDGGLQVLQERAPAFGITVFTRNYAPRDFLLELVLPLTDTIEGDELYDEIKTGWDWKATDGTMATIHRFQAPCLRIYSALRKIATLAKLQGLLAEDFDITTLYTREGVETLIDSLYPWKKIINDDETLKVFLDSKSGAFPLLEEFAPSLGVVNVGRKEGTRNLFSKLFDSPAVPACELKEFLKMIFLNADYHFDGDANVNNSLRYLDPDNRPDREHIYVSRRRYQRIYGPIYALAYLVNHGPAGEQIDLTKIHTRAEFEKLLGILFPWRKSVELTAEEISRFIAEHSGSLNYFRTHHTLYGSSAFNIRFGAGVISNQVVSSLDEDIAEREPLLKQISFDNYQWTENQGSNIVKGQRGPTLSFYRPIAISAHLLKTRHPEYDFDPAKLLVPEQMANYQNYLLFDRKLGTLTPAKRRVFLGVANGSVEWIRRNGNRYNAGYWAKNFAPMNFVLRLSSMMPQTEAVVKMSGWFSRIHTFEYEGETREYYAWNWKKNDGEMLNNGLDFPAAERLYRALYYLASVASEIFPEAKIDPEKIHTAEELQKLIRTLEKP